MSYNADFLSDLAVLPGPYKFVLSLTTSFRLTLVTNDCVCTETLDKVLTKRQHDLNTGSCYTLSVVSSCVVHNLLDILDIYNVLFYFPGFSGCWEEWHVIGCQVHLYSNDALPYPGLLFVFTTSIALFDCEEKRTWNNLYWIVQSPWVVGKYIYILFGYPEW